MSNQLFAGDFDENAGSINASFAKLNCSLPYDKRLFADDIDASKVWAEALQREGYISLSDCEKICGGFELVRYDWIENLIKILPTEEDVHTVNERRLTELIGETAQSLHIGRSRYDQVVTDLKLWLRKAIREICAELRQLMEAAMQQAELNLGVLMPGYSHLQRTQPVQFSHWMLSHAFAFRADCMHLLGLRNFADVLPLGSGDVAGNPLTIDRVWAAERLGFAAVTENSMHTVGDRDFVVDFIYCCSMASIHLSRLAEDLILYATKEFDYIKIDDAFCSGSGFIPQKRNPDSLELVRGISGSICAALTGAMMTIKGTPSSYNKDLQYIKKYCFDAFDQLQQALRVTVGVVRTLTLKRHQMEAALSSDMLATHWVYYLVRKGVPFGRAHQYIGDVVQLAEKMGVEITEIPLGKLQSICPRFAVDIGEVADYGGNVEQHNSIGGTSTNSIVEQLKILQEFIAGSQI